MCDNSSVSVRGGQDGEQAKDRFLVELEEWLFQKEKHFQYDLEMSEKIKKARTELDQWLAELLRKANGDSGKIKEVCKAYKVIFLGNTEGQEASLSEFNHQNPPLKGFKVMD